MAAVTDFLYMIDDFLWGTWMTVLLVGIGVVLSIRFAFRYQRKIIFNFKNTYGKIGAKGEGEGTISGFRAACTALANTVGTGNISGVATAIVSGGPGALVWMWVSAFFGMSTKACEIIIGQRYREHYKKSMNEYVCDRSFVLKNAFGWEKGAVILAVFCFLFGPWTCCVQTEAVTSSMSEAFGINPLISVIIIGITCIVTIWGGLRRISDVMSRAVPIMAVLYIIMGLGVLILNFQHIPAVVALIFRSAFSPTAAVGGFAGATVRDAIQYGVARGIYSNDAGTGYGMIAHASAQTDHPVRQSLWGWGRRQTHCHRHCRFRLDDHYRHVLHLREIRQLRLRRHRAKPKDDVEADALWAFTDILSALYVLITVFIIAAKHKEIFRLFDDFWKRYLPEKEAGKNPPYVTFDCKSQDDER